MTPRSPSLPVPKTLEESVQYYGRLFAECSKGTQDVMQMYMVKREEIRKKYPTWQAGAMDEKFDRVDARIGLFTKQINSLITTSFHHVLYSKSLCDLTWLQSNIHENYSSHLAVMEKQFDNCFKFAAQQCFNSIFHQMESSFRLFIKNVHPSGETLATNKFQNVYTALFARLDIKDRAERINLMQFMSVIRNSMHNNWCYIPTLKQGETAAPREFEYKQQKYTLIPNEFIRFITWTMIMDFAKDLLEVFDEMVNHPDIVSIPEIIEERFPSNE
ncbi:hypothetical protein A3D11_02215 [Candidatus Peribacteria bacterium RIFCSPHIGHO2_02_FULL_49_16]|nr:MAG: hypothetical protein A2880_03675 [Candidatus Peribacteria bacterium RIFCSPHIGHO2_01_FULL_49_38]OGJ59941.1 MAG: hypothetical protein A3D11_02215 [Candidatus Peribacteria bacterium RIFCSPHIGHO2_02_FULL_49_16]